METVKNYTSSKWLSYDRKPDSSDFKVLFATHLPEDTYIKKARALDVQYNIGKENLRVQ